MMQKRVIQLILEGLDSYAFIYINDMLIFTNDNMYQRNFVEIKKFLKKGTNTISIAFPSKTKWADDTAKTCNADTDGLCPRGCTAPPQHGFCNVQFVRTEPCSFSWDWGPAFASVESFDYFQFFHFY